MVTLRLRHRVAAVASTSRVPTSTGLVISQQQQQLPAMIGRDGQERVFNSKRII